MDGNGKHYRCNRKWLRATPEEVEPTVTIQDLGEEEDESSSAEVSLPTMPVPAEVPEPCTTSRPVRERRPPAWKRLRMWTLRLCFSRILYFEQIFFVFVVGVLAISLSMF